MFFAEIILHISRDTNPSDPGFQPSGVYIAISLVIPVFMGVIAGLISSLLLRIFRKSRTKTEVSGDL